MGILFCYSSSRCVKSVNEVMCEVCVSMGVLCERVLDGESINKR